MQTRFNLNSLMRPIFHNIVEESSLAIDQAACSMTPRVRAKTLWRLCNAPPASVTAGQWTMIARLAQKQQIAESADIIALARDPLRLRNISQLSAIISRVYPRSVKQQIFLGETVNRLAAAAKKIYIFDRTDSFGFFRPGPEEPDQLDPDLPPPQWDPTQSL